MWRAPWLALALGLPGARVRRRGGAHETSPGRRIRSSWPRHLVWAVVLAPWSLLIPGARGQVAWRFTDATGAAGVTAVHAYPPGPTTLGQRAAGGVAVGDLDGDGALDLYVVGGSAGRNQLLHNRGDGTFVDVGVPAGVALEGVSGSGPLCFDYDGDGRLDLFVGAVDGGQVALFHNQGDGTFADVTAGSGLVAPGGASALHTISATAGDYDGDGWLDLFLSHWQSPAPTCHLWRNLAGASFACADHDAGLDGLAPDGIDLTFTGNFADIDADGAPDLLITGDFGHSSVWHNRGGGAFERLTLPVISDENGMGSAIGDYDDDGDLDWFVSSVFDGDGVVEGDWGTTGNRLYRNHGDRTFDDQTTPAGVRDANWGWGSTFADLDNDGRLDLVVVNGWPQGSPQFRDSPSRLFIAEPAGGFVDRAAALGVDDRGDGRGVAALDYDGDGDLDLFVANNNGPYRLYRNDGGRAAGHFLSIALRAPAPNVFAVGARVRVSAGGREQLREIRAGTSYVSQDPLAAHFGLGAAVRVDRLEVTWPGGARTVLDDVGADQTLTITPETRPDGGTRPSSHGGCSGW